jgi:hypothetical protein
MELQKPTDRIIKATLVSLVRKVAWGPSRDMLLKESARLRAAAGEATKQVNGIVLNELFTHNAREGVEDDAFRDARQREGILRTRADELHWKSQLYALAAAARFPRDEDQTLKNFVMNIVEDIRQFQETGHHNNGCAMRDIAAAVASALEAEGLELKDLPLPPSLDEMIDRGMPRPDYISEEHWKTAEDAYFRKMTLDNTPDEFINGGYDRDEYERDEDFDWGENIIDKDIYDHELEGLQSDAARM